MNKKPGFVPGFFISKFFINYILRSPPRESHLLYPCCIVS